MKQKNLWKKSFSLLNGPNLVGVNFFRSHGPKTTVPPLPPPKPTKTEVSRQHHPSPPVTPQGVNWLGSPSTAFKQRRNLEGCDFFDVEPC